VTITSRTDHDAYVVEFVEMILRWRRRLAL